MLYCESFFNSPSGKVTKGIEVAIDYTVKEKHRAIMIIRLNCNTQVRKASGSAANTCKQAYIYRFKIISNHCPIAQKANARCKHHFPWRTRPETATGAIRTRD